MDGTWTSTREGGGQWTIISLPNSLRLFHMLISMCPNFGKDTTTLAEVAQKSVEQSYNTRTYASIGAYM